MKLNAKGLQLIKFFEQCKLKAYPDPATNGAPYTIGYGATGPGIGPTTVWTQAQADQALQDECDRVSRFIASLIKPKLTDNEFSALVSLTYNIGIGNFKSSTLLKLINIGDLTGANKEFIKWNKANGKVMNGLTARRQAEAELFDEV